MNLYPKWLLALAGLNLLSLLLSVFFLFGGLQPFGTSDNGVVRFLYYVATQLLWLFPIGCFFGTLRAYDRINPFVATLIALSGLAVLAVSVFLLV